MGQFVRLSMPPNTAYPVPSVTGSAVTLVCGTWTATTKTAVLRARAAGQAVASTTGNGCAQCNHASYDLRITVTKA